MGKREAMRVHSFEPVVDAASRVLVLGSMPGKASLRAHQYYAHPRNLFWRILGEVLGLDPLAPYGDRLCSLLRERIALWDVLKTCTRASSLDSDIVDSSRVPNDFDAFFAAHPGISAVFFNGAKAEASFAKLVAPRISAGGLLALHRLPSTSPANASVPFERKIEAWRRVVGAV